MRVHNKILYGMGNQFLPPKSPDKHTPNGNKDALSGKGRILWWKPYLGDNALHKMADLEIIMQLAHGGYLINAIVPAAKEEMTPLCKDARVRIISVRMKPLPLILPAARSVLLYFLLPVYIATFKPNFIITEPDVSILSFVPTVVFSKLRKTKLILDIRSVPVETFGFLGFLMNLWFNVSVLFAKKYFDGITIITSLMKEEVCARFRINPEKVGVWTSGVSTSLFDPSKYISGISEFREKLGLSSKFVVFYHGIFGPTRGLKQSIEAINILRNSHPNITLFLLGDGPIAPDLKRLIQEEKLENNVVIHGPVDQTEVPKFISMCDVAMIPLPNSQFWRHQSPLKLLEYLAMEKVVILTKIPAHTTVVGKSECGLYVSSIEPVKIAQAIEHAYINKSNLKSWGKAGRGIVMEKYTWQKIALSLRLLLTNLSSGANFGEE